MSADLVVSAQGVVHHRSASCAPTFRWSWKPGGLNSGRNDRACRKCLRDGLPTTPTTKESR